MFYLIFPKFTVYEHIDYALHNFANISAMTIGAFGYQIKGEASVKESSNYFYNRTRSIISSPKMSTPSVCYTRYRNTTLNPSLSIYHIDPEIVENWCLEVIPSPAGNYTPGSPNWSTFSYLNYLNEQTSQKLLDLENFESLLQLQLRLPLRTILLNTIVAFNTPQCFDLDVVINFDNRQLSGEITINLENDNRQIACYGNFVIF